MVVNEVFLDGDVRELTQGRGMLDVVTLMINLAEHEQAAATTQGPSSFTQGELTCWAFERYGQLGDTLRVVLFRTADRCFEIRALKKADSSLTFRDMSFAQQAFLGSLRW